MKRVSFILLFLSVQLVSIAQIDKVFWFAAPEVTSIHGDSPILLRFTSFDKAASITISFPANPALPQRKVNLNANSTTTVDLTNIKSSLENDVPNEVSNKGILIESSTEITAYYEVNAQNNPDIFTLKGRSGLGTEFYTPFQNRYNNYNYPAYSSFDVVATEDSTTITITPSVNMFFHGTSPFTIVLNKGQTYSVRARDGMALSHPVGSHIVSNKPIAVTIKDDSVIFNSSWDLIGDQLIPVKNLGSEYGISFGRSVIVATEDNTIININGTVVDTIDAGGYIYHDFMGNAGYINSEEEKKFYVLQIGGIDNELGGAILPSLGCTGSRKIAFTQSTFGEFKLMVLVKSGAQGDFKLNGNSSFVASSDFSLIGNGWMVAEIDLGTLFGEGTVFLLENATADFHLGIRNGTGTTGARFGYFSDFGVLDLGSDRSICENTKENELDAGISKNSYAWNTGETTQSIKVDTGGTYMVTVTKGECTFSDSVTIAVLPNAYISDLGNDTTICKGDSLVLLPGGAEFSYVWQDNATDTFFVVKEAGQYMVEVFNQNGCSQKDTINISLNEAPTVQLGNDTTICASSEYVLALEKTTGYEYLWSTGETDTTIVVKEAGFYSVNVKNICGSDFESIIVDFWSVSIPNIVTPNDDGKNDFFEIAGLNKGQWSLVVRNRWGDEVYNNPMYENTFSPKRLSDGMYYYHLKESDTCNDFIGWVLIER